MATKKREIYARAAVQLRTHDRAVQAETLCPGSMGLYLWMLLQARGEESDGDVLEAAAVAAWGAPASFRRKQIEALIAVKLVDRTAERLSVVKYAEHNDDRETITTNRKASAAKKQKQRHPEIANDHSMSPRDSAGTTPVVPISSSYSISSSSSESRSEEPDSEPRAREPRRFDAGTASSVRALEVFESAASSATGGDFALAQAPFHVRDLCLALNKHAPKELANKADILRWLESVIAVWIRACDPPTIEPGKFLTWLNNGRKSPPKRVDTRQPLTGPEPDWLTRAKTGTDGTEVF